MVLVGSVACAAPEPDAVIDPQPPAPLAGGAAPDVAARVLGPRADLELASRHTSPGGEHLRYRRLAPDGTRVVGHEVSVHLDGAGGVWSRAHVLGNDLPALQLVGQRRIDEATALARARALVTEGRIVETSIEAVALADAATAGVVRPGYRAVVETREPAHGWEIWVDGDGHAKVVRDTYFFADGTGLVYDPNPTAQTGDLTIVDGNDATSPKLDNARFMVTLPRLDGTGNLRGEYADVSSRANMRVTSPNLAFAFARDDNRFNEVNAYFHIDAAQARLQALGFDTHMGRAQVLYANAGNQDNSFYSPSSKRIEMGTGGVDDAEDADVVVHEYGHAVQDAIVPGYGSSSEAGAMGEGFGDLLAASVLPADAAHTQMIARACIAAWDATSYDDRTPPCLRRIDGAGHYPEDVVGQVHADGEIWSAGMWQLYELLGDPALGLKLVVEGFHRVQPNTTFLAYSEALLAADVALHAGANADKIKRALWARGLYRVPAAPGVFEGTPASMTVDLGTPMPLSDDADDQITINHPGAGAIRVHFSAFAMESDANCLDMKCDNVYVFDGAGTLYGILGGALGAVDGPIVPGDTVVLRWVTDGSVASTGFRIDRYDYGAAGTASDGGMPEPTEDAGMPGPEAGIDMPEPSGKGEDGGCCGASRSADASPLLGLVGLAWITRRRRQPASTPGR